MSDILRSLSDDQILADDLRNAADRFARELNKAEIAGLTVAWSIKAKYLSAPPTLGCQTAEVHISRNIPL